MKIPGCGPLRFPGYPEKLKKAQEKTGLTEAVVTALGTIGGRRCVVGVMDSRFFMGSMSAAVGEKITLAMEYATKSRLPLILFLCQRWGPDAGGDFSLMQMAKDQRRLGAARPKRDYCIYPCSQIPLPAA